MCAFDPLAEIATLPPDSLLALGSRGRAVRLLRRALAAQGYGPGAWSNHARPVSDCFDEPLKLVLLQFQRDCGLADDGVAGPRTLRALAVQSAAARPPGRAAAKPARPRIDPLAPLREAAAAASGSAVERALAVARRALELQVRESGGRNRGPLVEAMQRFAGGAAGDAWCLAFCDVCLRLGAQAAGTKLPLRIGMSCSRLIRRAHAQGRVFEVQGFGSGEYPAGQAAPGDLLVLRGGRTGYKHVGLIVEAPDSMQSSGSSAVRRSAPLLITIEGNTNDRGSAEGDGVYEKQRNLHRNPAVLVRLV